MFPKEEASNLIAFFESKGFGILKYEIKEYSMIIRLKRIPWAFIVYRNKKGEKRLVLPKGISADYRETIYKLWNEYNGKKLKGYHLFVDGSYRDGRAAYGVVCIKDGKIVKTLSGSFKLQGGTRNVAGEIQGVLKALEWSAKNGIKEICLHYDYEGLANWINGTWKAKIPLTQGYVKRMKELSQTVKIHWIKEKAHSGSVYNEMADVLARKALDSN
ncbi:MAG: reverse transcriptase-like protein [Kosmotoga sp.]|uniref:RNase H family protein n=1 Tax=Kosmotoga sp. TaxID=1955248 RepID=UPI001D832D7D|nr:RNase H family protein [Kosmotoga sp.]MBO8166651.1 reverse transcriptase-like protein [Kosmotoga sp.]